MKDAVEVNKSGFYPLNCINFIYAGEYYIDFVQKFEALCRLNMYKYRFGRATATLLSMQRWDIVTKETMVDAYKGYAQSYTV